MMEFLGFHIEIIGSAKTAKISWGNDRFAIAPNRATSFINYKRLTGQPQQCANILTDDLQNTLIEFPLPNPIGCTLKAVDQFEFWRNRQLYCLGDSFGDFHFNVSVKLKVLTLVTNRHITYRHHFGIMGFTNANFQKRLEMNSTR